MSVSNTTTIGSMWVQLLLLLWCVVRLDAFTEVFSITKDSVDNSYYVGNKESNFFIGKRDPSCGFEWTSTDGSTSGDDDRDQNDEILHGVIVADDGLLYATGSTRGNFSSPTDEAPNLDAAVIVYDTADGSAVRQKQYDIVASFDNVGSAIVQKPDGLLLVSVYGSLPNVQNSAIFETRLLEIDAETLETQNVYTLTVTTSEFFRVTGGPKILDFIFDDSSNSIVAVGHILGRGILWRYSLDSGSVTSQAEWGTAFGSYQISGFTSDGAGAFYVVGSSLENVLGNSDLSSPAISDFHAYVIRYDGLTATTTTETWVRQLNAPGSSQSGSDITIDPVTGEIVVIGTFDADFEVTDSQTSEVFQVPSITNNGLTDIFVWVLEPLTGNFTELRISDLASTSSEDRGNAVQVLSNRQLEIGGVINDGTNGDPVVCDDSKVPSPSPTTSGSPSLSPTPSPNPTSSMTPTATQTSSMTPTASHTSSMTPTASHTMSALPTASYTSSATPSASYSASVLPTMTHFSTPSPTQSVSQLALGSPAISLRVSLSPSFSLIPSADSTQSLVPSVSRASSFSMVPSQFVIVSSSASPISITQAGDMTASAISSPTRGLLQDTLENSPLPSLLEPSAFESALPSPSSLVIPSPSLQTDVASAAATPASPSFVMSLDGLANSPVIGSPVITVEIIESMSLQPSASVALGASPFSSSTPSVVLRISAIPSPSFAQIPSVTPSGIIGTTSPIGSSMTPTSTFILATSESVSPNPSTLVVSLSVSPDVSLVLTSPFAVPSGNNRTFVTPALPDPSDEGYSGQVLPSIAIADMGPEESLTAMAVTIFPSYQLGETLPVESVLPSFTALAMPGDYPVTPSTMLIPQVSLQASYIGVFSPTIVLDLVNGLDAMASATFEDVDFSPGLPLLPSTTDSLILPSQQFYPGESLHMSPPSFPVPETSLKAEVPRDVLQTSPEAFRDISYVPSPSMLPEFVGGPSLLSSPNDFHTFSPITAAPESGPVAQFPDEEQADSVNSAEPSLDPPAYETSPILSPSLLPEVNGGSSLQTSPEGTTPIKSSPLLGVFESPPALGGPGGAGGLHAVSSAEASLAPSGYFPEPSLVQGGEMLPSFSPVEEASPFASDDSTRGRSSIDPNSPRSTSEGETISETRGPFTNEDTFSQPSIGESFAPSLHPLDDELLSTSQSTGPRSSPSSSKTPAILSGEESVEPLVPQLSSAVFPSPSALPMISPPASAVPTAFPHEVFSEASPAASDHFSEAFPTSQLPELATPNEFDDVRMLPSQGVLLLGSSPGISMSDAPQTSLLLSPTAFSALIDVSPFGEISFAPIAFQTFEQSPENSVFLILWTPEPSGIVLSAVTPGLSASIAYSFESTTEPNDDAALLPSLHFTPSSDAQATRGIDLNPTVTVTVTPRPTVTGVVPLSPTVTVTPQAITSSELLIPSTSRPADPVSSFGVTISPSAVGPVPSEPSGSVAPPTLSASLPSGSIVPITSPSSSATPSLESDSSTPMPSSSVALLSNSLNPSPLATIPMQSFVSTFLPSQLATPTTGLINSTPPASPSTTLSLEQASQTFLPSPPTASSSGSLSLTPSPILSVRPSLQSVAPTNLPSASNTPPSASSASKNLPSPSATSSTGSASIPSVHSSPSTSGIGPSQLVSLAPASSLSPTQEEEGEDLEDALISPSMPQDNLSPSASQATSPPPSGGAASFSSPTPLPERVSPTPGSRDEVTPIPLATTTLAPLPTETPTPLPTKNPTLSPTKTPTPLPLLSVAMAPADPEASESAVDPQRSSPATITPLASLTLSSPSSASFESSPSEFRSLEPSSILTSPSLSPRVSQSQPVASAGTSLPFSSAESFPSISASPSASLLSALSTVDPSASASAVILARSPSQSVTAGPTNRASASPSLSVSPVTSQNPSSEDQEPFLTSSGFASPAFATAILETPVFETPSPTRTPTPLIGSSQTPAPTRTRTAIPSPSSSVLPSPRSSESGTTMPDAGERVSPAVDASETPFGDLDETPVPSEQELCCDPEISQSSSPTPSLASSNSLSPTITPTPSAVVSSSGQTPSTSPSPTNIPDFTCNKPEFAVDPSLLQEASNFQRVEMVIQVAGPNLTNACGLSFPIAERFINLSAVNTQSTASLWFVTLVEDGPPVFSSSSSLVTIEVVNNAPVSAETISVTPSPSPSSGEDSKQLFAGSVIFHVTAYLNSLSVRLAEGSYVEYIDSQNIIRRMKEEGYEDIEWTGMVTVPRVVDVRGSTKDVRKTGGISAGAIGAVSAVTAMIVGVAVLIFKDGLAMTTNDIAAFDRPIAEMV